MSEEIITLEKLAATVFKLLTPDQARELTGRLDRLALAAHAFDLMTLPQLTELAAMIASECIRAGKLRIKVDPARINEGMLEYLLEGETAYLEFVAEELAARGTMDFEKLPMFHQISTVIMGAQAVAAEMDAAGAEPILARGRALETLELGTRKRAEATQQFLEDLFAFIDRKRAEKAATA
jgi:hypothetical protein